MAAIKTCFIAAPPGANLTVLTSTLRQRGLRVLAPRDLEVGVDWSLEAQKQLAQADLVIGVLTEDQSSSWVLFELGQASALGRRIILIASPRAERLPFSLQRFLVLRTEVDNADAIGFALDQVLMAPMAPNRDRVSQPHALVGLGPQTDILIARLEEIRERNQPQALENLVADALRASGVEIVLTSHSKELRADIAVWSDVLEPFVGNPLLIEVKLRLQRSDLLLACEQLAEYVHASGARWGVLLYGSGPELGGDVANSSHPNILILSVRSLLDRLRIQAFPELIRDLRNLRVHGVP